MRFDILDLFFGRGRHCIDPEILSHLHGSSTSLTNGSELLLELSARRAPLDDHHRLGDPIAVKVDITKAGLHFDSYKVEPRKNFS
jgi:hypothetical protein